MGGSPYIRLGQGGGPTFEASKLILCELNTKLAKLVTVHNIVSDIVA